MGDIKTMSTEEWVEYLNNKLQSEVDRRLNNILHYKFISSKQENLKYKELIKNLIVGRNCFGTENVVGFVTVYMFTKEVAQYLRKMVQDMHYTKDTVNIVAYREQVQAIYNKIDAYVQEGKIQEKKFNCISELNMHIKEI